MKVGIVGVGAVGSACLLSLVARGTARGVVVVDKNQARARGVAWEQPKLFSEELRAGFRSLRWMSSQGDAPC